jgi:ABC-type phosphate transport system substrate-binding protein
MNRKFLARWANSRLLSFSMIIISSCQANGDTEAPVEPEENSGSLIFVGSTSVQPLANLLKDDFIEPHPQVGMEIAAGGSYVGIQVVHDGVVDFGMASRNPSKEE